MGRLFGTDGVRGVANTQLSCALALSLGKAAAAVLTKHTNHKPKILIGKDSRVSSDMLESCLAGGICSIGADVMELGVVPTPAVSYLTRLYQADAGIMISASHNTPEYNGIKIFNAEGFKLSDELEDEIEAFMQNESLETVVPGDKTGQVHFCRSGAQDYADHLLDCADVDLTGLKVAFDCANGSAGRTVHKIFEKTGAQCFIFCDECDGAKINQGCGSTHLENISRLTREHGCDIGFAFDGDADRCLAVDAQGEEIDGDKIIAILAHFLKAQQRLKNNTVVVTVMSNLGFFEFAKGQDIDCVRTKVGDRYVLEEMLKGGHNIGGEQSGHIILLDYMNTGDGQLSALMLLKVLKQTQKTAKELANLMEHYPQVLIGVKVPNHQKETVLADQDICTAIQNAQAVLQQNGRVLVRASGTEPLIRVMIEGKDTEQIQQLAQQIAAKIKERYS